MQQQRRQHPPLLPPTLLTKILIIGPNLHRLTPTLPTASTPGRDNTRRQSRVDAAPSSPPTENVMRARRQGSVSARYEYQKMGLIKNGTTCVTKTTTHTYKKLQKWPNRGRTTPSPMALFDHYLSKNHPTKNAIKQKYSPRACTSSGHTPWHCPMDLPFHGFPPALLTIFYILNRQQGSRSG